MVFINGGGRVHELGGAEHHGGYISKPSGATEFYMESRKDSSLSECCFFWNMLLIHYLSYSSTCVYLS